MLKRRLNEDEREAVIQALLKCSVATPEVCQRAVKECVLLQRTPLVNEIRGLTGGIAYAALKTSASAITLGNRVFIRREFFSDDAHIPLDLIAHEVTHVAQFIRDGVLSFLYAYTRDYMLGLAGGLGDRGAYLAIGHEVEARRVVETLAQIQEHPHK